MVEVSAARVVAVLTRAPSAAGKTRLFAALGRPPDPALLSALLLDTLDGVDAPGVVRVVAVEPAHSCAEVRACVPAGVQVMAQEEGSLGDRMRAVMSALLVNGARAVALTGSDLPEITPPLLLEAFELLNRDPEALVLGPATDGGYYLIAATILPAVFDGIAWGRADVLDQTVTVAERQGLHVHFLRAIADVDTPIDLQRLVERERDAPRTRQWAASHGFATRRDSATDGSL